MNWTPMVDNFSSVHLTSGVVMEVWKDGPRKYVAELEVFGKTFHFGVAPTLPKAKELAVRQTKAFFFDLQLTAESVHG